MSFSFSSRKVLNKINELNEYNLSVSLSDAYVQCYIHLIKVAYIRTVVKYNNVNNNLDLVLRAPSFNISISS